MTTPSNPFVLPGLGKGAEHAGNPLAASMEMMRQAWSSLSGAGGLAQSMPMTPPLSLEELERRIADLRTVEGWLQMNLSLLSNTIQGLEVQRATISTLRAFADGMSAAPSGEPSPLEILLGIRQGKGAWSASDKGKPRAAAEPPKPQPAPEAAEPKATDPTAVPEPVASASQAWWNLLHKQFDQIAAATAASMPQTPAPSKEAAAPRTGSAQAPSASQTGPAATQGGKPAGKPARAGSAGRATKRPAARKRTPTGSSNA